MEQTISVIPIKSYYVAISYRHESIATANKYCYFYADVLYNSEWGQNSAGIVASTPVNDASAKVWKDFSTTQWSWAFTPMTCTAKIQLQCICNPGFSNAIYVDEIKFTQVDHPTKTDNC